MTTTLYLENINKRYKLGNATEHTFRGDLQNLLEALVQGIAATNETASHQYYIKKYFK